MNLVLSALLPYVVLTAIRRLSQGNSYWGRKTEPTIYDSSVNLTFRGGIDHAFDDADGGEVFGLAFEVQNNTITEAEYQNTTDIGKMAIFFSEIQVYDNKRLAGDHVIQ